MIWESAALLTALPPLPPRWAARIAWDHALASILQVPEIQIRQSPAPVQAIPADWVQDCRQNPYLLRLIRPEYRTATASGPMVMEDHRVTVFFDDQGRN